MPGVTGGYCRWKQTDISLAKRLTTAQPRSQLVRPAPSRRFLASISSSQGSLSQGSSVLIAGADGGSWAQTAC